MDLLLALPLGLLLEQLLVLLLLLRCMCFIMYILECLRAMHEKDEATRKKHQLEHLGGTFE